MMKSFIATILCSMSVADDDRFIEKLLTVSFLDIIIAELRK